jgi:hypothetical protein
MALLQQGGNGRSCKTSRLSALRDISSQVSLYYHIGSKDGSAAAGRQWPLSLNFTTISSQRHLTSGNIILPQKMALVQLASSEEAVASLVKLHTISSQCKIITTSVRKMDLVLLSEEAVASLVKLQLQALKVKLLQHLLKRWLWCSWPAARRQWPLLSNFATTSSQGKINTTSVRKMDLV